jgi:S1-C subfamily serine protease
MNKFAFIVLMLFSYTLYAGEFTGLTPDSRVTLLSSLSATIVSVRSERQDSASGFVVSPDGLVLTVSTLTRNRHSVQVRFADGRTFAADVIAKDHETESALLRIQSPESHTFSFLALGDSSAVKIGSHATSAGNPLDSILADHQVAVSSGTITSIYDVQSADADSRYLGPALETDAAINSGSEGGALLNDAEQVIGMVCLAVDRTRMRGTAVPINRIKTAYEKFLVANNIDASTALALQDGTMKSSDRAIQALVKIHLPDSTETVSGVVIDEAGHVLTSGTFALGQQVDVERAAGRIARATVLRHSESMDLSLLKLDSAEENSCIPLKETASIVPGIRITILGRCALCEMPTINTGIVSAVGRLGGLTAQSNARLTANTAGGAVLNRRGELIGIVSHTKSMCELCAQNAGVSFFTPAGLIRSWIDELTSVAAVSVQRPGEKR